MGRLAGPRFHGYLPEAKMRIPGIIDTWKSGPGMSSTLEILFNPEVSPVAAIETILVQWAREPT